MKQRTKNTILVIGFVMIVIMAYKYAISNTLQLHNDYKSLKKDADIYNNLPLQLAALKQKEKYYDSLLIKYQLNGNSVQNSMLSTINAYAEKHNLKIVSFLEPHQIIEQDLIINTYKFTLEGGYNAIVNLLHQLEQKTKFGEIINLNFEKKKNYRSGTYYLQASVLLSGIE